MSIDEYNRHATLGQMAGPATSASAMAGQAAYQRNHEQRQAVGEAAPPPSLRASLGILAFFGVVCALGAAAAYVLPEESALATAAAYTAGLSALAFVIMALFLCFKAAQFAAGLVIVVGLRYFGWSAAAALVGFVFAEFHDYVFEPYPTWTAALGAGLLALIAQAVRALRCAAFALAVGAVAYVLIASHVFNRHSAVALALGGVLTLVSFFLARVFRSRRS